LRRRRRRKKERKADKINASYTFYDLIMTDGKLR
jgi:hypothetical protein